MSKWIKGSIPRSKKNKWYQVTYLGGVVGINYFLAENENLAWQKSAYNQHDRSCPVIAYSEIKFLKPYKE